MTVQHWQTKATLSCLVPRTHWLYIALVPILMRSQKNSKSFQYYSKVSHFQTASPLQIKQGKNRFLPDTTSSADRNAQKLGSNVVHGTDVPAGSRNQWTTLMHSLPTLIRTLSHNTR